MLKNCFRGCALNPACFWIESLNHLVIGYHWLAFINSVNVSEKISSQKLKILLNEKIQENWKKNVSYVSEHCASFGTKKKLATFRVVRSGLHVAL